MIDPGQAHERTERRSILLGLLFVLLVATTLRGFTYFEIRGGPLLHLHAWTQSDMHFFDGWARDIAAGDLLTRDGTRPYHGRHVKLACRAFVLEGGAPAACTADEVARIWDRWVGPRSFWQDPLYPYFLASLYRTFGRSSGVVYAVQSIMGLVCVALIYLLALRLFDLRAAVVAGLTAALFGPLIFYEGTLLRAVPIATLLLTACYALVVASDGEKARPGWLFAAGILGGLLCLLKMSWLLTVAAWGVALVASRAREGIGGVLRVGIAYGAGLIVAFSPLVARNAILETPLFKSAATGPINLLNGNAADRVVGGGSAISDLAAAILSSSGGVPTAMLKATLATHESLVDWFGLLVAKLAMFFTPREIPNNVNYEYFLEHMTALSTVSVGFSFIAVLAVFGLKPGSGRRYAHSLLLASIVTGIAVCVLFFNLSRFRLPVACMMIPLAGGGYSVLVGMATERRWRTLTAAGVVAVGLCVAIAFSMRADVERVRIADYGVANEIAVKMARRAASQGDKAGALAIALRQLETEPPELTAIRPGPDATSISVHLSGVAGTFVDLHEVVVDMANDDAPGAVGLGEHHGRRAQVLRRLNAPYAATEGR